MLLRILVMRTKEPKPYNLGKKWVTLALSPKEDDENEHLFNHSDSPTTFNNLLELKKVAPVNTLKEKMIERMEKERANMSSLSRAQSEVDSEVAHVFNNGVKQRKRKKRGNNWTRPKRRYTSMSRKTPASTYYARSRPATEISILTTDSYKSLPRSSPIKNSPFNLNNSVDKFQEDLYYEEEVLHQCEEKGCGFMCEDIDLMAQHKNSRHKRLLWFKCDLCSKQYADR